MSGTQQITTTITDTESLPQTSANNQTEELVLHLAPTESAPRVRWTTDTVDNEFMQKKKSKCCCIYKKARNWNESSDEDSDCETGNCKGHVEKKNKENA